MNFLKKNISTLGLAIAFCLTAFVPEVLAADTSGTVFDTALSKGAETFKAVRSVIFLVGGFGLVALAFFAVFGKLKWTWFASLAVGLAILAAAGAIIDYVTSDDGAGAGDGSLADDFEDSLTGSGSVSIPSGE